MSLWNLIILAEIGDGRNVHSTLSGCTFVSMVLRFLGLSLCLFAGCSQSDNGPAGPDASAESSANGGGPDVSSIESGPPQGPCQKEGEQITGDFFAHPDGGTHPGVCTCTSGTWACCPMFSISDAVSGCLHPDLACWDEGLVCHLFDAPCSCGGFDPSVDTACDKGKWSGACFDCPCGKDAGGPDATDAKDGGSPQGPCTKEGEQITGDFFEHPDGGTHPGICTCTGGAWHCCPDFYPGYGSCISSDLACYEEGAICHLFDLPCPCYPLSISIACQGGKWTGVCWDCFCDAGFSDAAGPD